MKNSHLTFAVAGLFILAAVTPLIFPSEPKAPAPAATQTPPTSSPTVTPEQMKTAFSYCSGFALGKQIAQGPSTLQLDDIDKEIFFCALADSLSGKEPSMNEEEFSAGLAAFSAILEQRAKAIADENLQKGKAFEEEFSKREGVVTTESGLMYRVITAGEGRTYDEAQDGADALAHVTFVSRLIDGTVYDKCAQPLLLPLADSGIIPGMSRALKLMPIGSEWEICIPASLAYGEQGAPGVIPPNATIIITVKLHNISKAEEPQGGAAARPFTPEMIEQLRAQGLEVVTDEEVSTAE